MKSAKHFVEVITTAWNQLDAELIIKHLDESFIYDSQWVFDSLDYSGYINYIRGKFATLKNSIFIIVAETVADPQFGGYMTKISQTNPTTNNTAVVFYRVQVRDNKIVKGDLCMF